MLLIEEGLLEHDDVEIEETDSLVFSLTNLLRSTITSGRFWTLPML